MRFKTPVWMLMTALMIDGAAVRAQSTNEKDYIVPVYSGPRAKPDFARSGPKFSRFRTAITDGFKSNEIAAGHYTIITIGCGTGCTFNVVGDVQTGELFEFPIGGEFYQSLEIITRSNSRLMVARWGASYDNECTGRIYALQGTKFTQIGKDRRKGSNC
ncbi:hypothetical protein [Sphingobium sp.]|uniref:hypothetical protein n=1 Tax=Sphingobium sp. TaxID=1912891 RepID=UPI0025CC62E3|nr:hypothetical protein [Sphingobium sp.]